jgi:hypothetical protein
MSSTGPGVLDVKPARQFLLSVLTRTNSQHCARSSSYLSATSIMNRTGAKVQAFRDRF